MAESAGGKGAEIAVSAPMSARARIRASSAGWALFVGAVFLILFGPLAVLAAFSFNDSTILAFPFEGLTLRWYSLAWHDSQLRTALFNSFGVAFVVTPTALVLGTLMAFGLTRFRFRLRAVIGGLVGAPLVLPWVVLGIAALLFYGRLNIDLNLRTVVATQIVATFPLVTAIVGASLFRFERAQEEVAIDLGCSRLQVLRYVILPHIAPAVAAGTIFAFTWSFNNFETTFFTIGFQDTFPTWVFSSVRSAEHLAVVNAVSAVISVVQVLMIYGGLRMLRARGGTFAPGLAETQVRGAA